MTEFDDIRDRLEDAEQRVDRDDVYIVGDPESAAFPTPEEFEQRHGVPPEEAEGLVIHVPAEAEGY